MLTQREKSALINSKGTLIWYEACINNPLSSDGITVLGVEKNLEDAKRLRSFLIVFGLDKPKNVFIEKWVKPKDSYMERVEVFSFPIGVY